MPIIDGEYVFPVTGPQLDEIISNIQYGSINYSTLQKTTTQLFSAQTVAASSTVKNTLGLYTGNNAKMSVTFSLTGASTNCTMILYGSDHVDLSMPRKLAIITLSTGNSDGQAIDPPAIPAYSFTELNNSDPVNPAIGKVEITIWKEAETA